MPLSADELKTKLLARALALGFDDARVTPAVELQPDLGRFEAWLAAGMHGEMDYMRFVPSSRGRPQELLPGARSVVALACSYYPGEHPEPPAETAPGRVARYAWGRDYHRIVGRRLKLLSAYLRGLAPGASTRTFVDSSPLLERAVASRAGLGFIGKNTMLIHRRLGSWVFLAALITDQELPPDPAVPGDCGQCRLCLDACPTGAFPEPFVLDARRCISHWTIEAASGHPAALAEQFGDWAFGCDVCQEVCPYNHRPLATGGASRFAGSRTSGAWTDAVFLANADEKAFRARYRRSPLNRPGRQGMARNALTVLANSLRRPR